MSNEPKLLVVDDEDAICEGCSRIFSRQGFEVEKCSDACRGLDLATRTDYCAILLDMKMPGMDGIHFLESLRKSKPSVPVVLMTGYPSIPNAASAIRLGVSDYVTKPFTPEEISQAVHRLIQRVPGDTPVAALPETPANTDAEFRFYREAWLQTSGDGPARIGAMIVRHGADKVDSIRLPRIGEVVYQGLPLAAVTIDGQPPRTIPSPVSGVVIEVNESLASDPAPLLADPCGKGWIACISPTRLAEESQYCTNRRVILLCRDRQSVADYTKKLRWLGCNVRAISTPADFDTVRNNFDSHVLLFDAASFGSEGPGIVGEINAKDPALRIVILAANDSVTEPAYRVRRIFYYAVEPFADNEIADIIAAAFQAQASTASPGQHRMTLQTLNGVSITNRNGKRVRLLAAPGLLRQDDGLGQMLRQKLLSRRFPLESSPDDIQITPMNLLSLANRCDRLIVLLAQDIGRLPGSLAHDTKAEYVALTGPGADKVTTLLVQPTAPPESPLGFEPSIIDALAEYMVREMAAS
jgi:FixJ family two-component response regulator/glycine cleavage system H lipoate-binding protein